MSVALDCQEKRGAVETGNARDDCFTRLPRLAVQLAKGAVGEGMCRGAPAGIRRPERAGSRVAGLVVTARPDGIVPTGEIERGRISLQVMNRQQDRGHR